MEDDNDSEIFKLDDLEKANLLDSQADYISGNIILNEEVILRNREWLEE
ncbi:MAG: hypothetical protein WCJ95_10275 [Mariniphaga sp.]